MIFQLILFFLPWSVRRALLQKRYGYRIAPTARIGYSVIRSRHLDMAAGAVIGSLTYVKGVEHLVLGEEGRLGSLNWVTAFPRGNDAFFSHVKLRDPSLRIGNHAAVTARHLIDCTGGVTIGAFTTFGGWGSQILTHSIDPAKCLQDAAPVNIGAYCFIGTRVVILKGSMLPDRSILAAGSVLAGAFTEPLGLYSGVPATRARELPPEYLYFHRTVGYVW
jgi:acetyltransferase-like isoleucine patch superfamily enzyme